MVINFSKYLGKKKKKSKLILHLKFGICVDPIGYLAPG